MQRVLVFLVLFILIPVINAPAAEKLSGRITIFHAGSLSVPFETVEKQFESVYPGLEVVREASGSQKAARKIIDLHKPCDIVASADYWVIDKLLIPQYAEWNVQFASNRIVLCYTKNSRFAREINKANWYEVLQKKNVEWGHSDPDLDPCGYRSIMVMQLAERHYGIRGLYKKLSASLKKENIRPKSVELISLLQTGNLDYAWEYLSVAMQHKLEYVDLPDKTNLGDSRYDSFYQNASVFVAGEEPGQKMNVRGESCVYGVTLLKNAPNREAALLFLEFLLDPARGLKIIEETGQPVLVPCRIKGTKDKVPARLQKYIVTQK